MLADAASVSLKIGGFKMGHPDGGHGTRFRTRHTFRQACVIVGKGMQFPSTTKKQTTARVAATEAGERAIAFYRENGGWGGNVCESCWGFRQSCVRTRIGQWVEGLDQFLR